MVSLSTDLLDGPFPELAIKAPVRVATTAPITLFGLQTIDGVAVEYGDRVLVKNQSDAIQNGIWIASESPWRRASDADGAYDITNGTRVVVQSGTANGGLTFICNSTVPTVVGTSLLVFIGEIEASGLARQVLSAAGILNVTSTPYGATTSVLQTPNQRTTAIQQAINDAATLGLKVFIPAGVWLINATLFLPSNTYLTGAGRYATVVKLDSSVTNGFNVITNQSNVRNISNVGNKNIYVEHLTAHGNIRRFGLDNVETAIAADVVIAPHTTTTYVVAMPNVVGTGQRVQAYVDLANGDEIDGISVKVATITGQATVTVINTQEVPLTIPAGSKLVCSRYTYSVGSATYNCAFGFSNVTNLTLNNVRGCYAGKHALSIDASLFDLGDAGGVTQAAYPPGPSRFCYVVNSEFTQGGDDNITTHGSEWVWFNSVRSYNAGHTYEVGNSNGFEIDDNSRYVWMTDCRAINCTNGIEIKGHDAHPAAQSLWVKDFYAAYTDNGAVDCHNTWPTIGKVFRINGLTTKNCRRVTYFYNYQDIELTNFRFEDDGWFIPGEVIIDIQNGARDVKITNGYIGIQNGATGVYIQDGLTNNVTIENVSGYGGYNHGVYTGSAVATVRLRNIILTNPNPALTTGGVSYGLNFYNDPATYDIVATGCRFTGYTNQAQTSRGGTPVLYTTRAVDFQPNRTIVMPQTATELPAGASVPLVKGRSSVGLLGGLGMNVNSAELQLGADGSGLIVTGGSGSPEGVVQAAIGSTYISADGREFRKTTAAPASTGWVLASDIDAGSSKFYLAPTIWISSGVGSPEGVVTAPVGCMWTRSDGGASTTLYVKQTGAGNTGWAAK